MFLLIKLCLSFLALSIIYFDLTNLHQTTILKTFKLACLMKLFVILYIFMLHLNYLDLSLNLILKMHGKFFISQIIFFRHNPQTLQVGNFYQDLRNRNDEVLPWQKFSFLDRVQVIGR